ncbi:MAG: hypothetical protein EOM23_06235 [Candidatus Moranbacteria bacterium]|nr:hypothetical protein [Candidatus Moranbacteria bacterium]
MKKISRKVFILAAISYGLKLFVALVLQKMVYGGFYLDGDMNRYFMEGMNHYSDISNHFFSYIADFFLRPVFGTYFMVRLSGLIFYVLGPTMEAGAAFCVFASSVGSYFFFLSFHQAFPKSNYLLFARLLFLWPSLLFWNSLLLKDPLLYSGLGFATFGLFIFLRGNRYRGGALFALGVTLGFMLKPHVMLFFILVVPLLIVTRKKKQGGLPLFLKVFFVVLTVFLGIFAYEFLSAHYVKEDVSLAESMANIQSNMAYGGSALQMKQVTSVGDIVYVPYNVMTVIFRPFIFEAHNAMALFSALEGSVLMMYAFHWFSKRRRSKNKKEDSAFLMFCIIYVLFSALAWSCVMGNMGTIVRQRIHLLPMLFMIIASGKMRRV